VVAAVGILTLLAHPGLAQERATAGDPIDLFTGLHTREYDDILVGGSPPIRLTRSYRNRDPLSRAFGIGTSHTYEMHLSSDSPTLAYADVALKDGARIRYVRTSPGSSHEGAQLVHTATPSEFLMSRLRWTGETWDIELRDGGRYRFPACHEPRYRGRVCRLIEVRDADGRRLELKRDEADNLTRISSGWFSTVHLTYDAANRIVGARTGLGLAMTTVAYEYDSPGRLVSVRWHYINALTVLAELLSSYSTWRFPSWQRMWLAQTMEYTYDERHNMLIVKEPGMELDHEYDQVGRVIRQKVTGWGVWKLSYTEAQGKVVQADVIDPDGVHRRVGFNADGYSLSDTIAPGQSNEEATTYERTTGNVVTRLTVSCRAAIGVPISVSAPVSNGTPEGAVRSRLRSQCGR
jgi:YD repeat-containing protein